MTAHRQARIAQLAEKLLPEARRIVAERVASGAWQAWKDQPERLERLAREIARWDAEKLLSTTREYGAVRIGRAA